MRHVFTRVAAVLLALLAYFLLWPVPIDPVAWQAPVNIGYADPFTANNQLQYIKAVGLNEFSGPEDVTLGADGNIYATTENGAVVQVRNRQVKAIAQLHGRPLGIAASPDGVLIVANPYVGLQRVALDGSVETMLGEIDGVALEGANNLAVSRSGIVYFSVSSEKFSAEDYRGTYAASIVDLIEHGGHGAVYSFTPETGQTRLLMDDLNYANGVAISDDEQFLLVSETGHYRILKHWLAGPRQGQTEVLLENLPAFPDNIKSGLNGRYWIGMPAPRNALIDRLSDKPWLRKAIWRLPAALRPKATPVSHVIAINGDGEVLMNLHDAAIRYPALTGVLETPDVLIFSTLFGDQLPLLSKSDL